MLQGVLAGVMLQSSGETIALLGSAVLKGVLPG